MSEEPKLPHAYPFRFISREGGEGVLSFSSSCGDGAGRGGPVPACVVLEAMTQGGGLLAASGKSRGGALVQVARFRCPRPVRPGDVLLLTAQVLNRMGPLLRVKVAARRDGRLAARAVITIRETPA